MSTIEKGMTVSVLDHGYVKYIDSMGSDETIIEAARMSTGKGFNGWDKDANLLEFLWSKKHATPFEMCELALEIQAPIFVFREWHRHRTQSYNEFSARYAQMPNVHYLPDPSRIQVQDKNNKQGSGGSVDEDYAEMVIGEFRAEQDQTYEHYEQLIGEGVAKEIARLNTPVSRYSKMRAKTDLRNWLAFADLRMRPNAQWEIRQFAKVVGEIIETIWPRTWYLFEEYTLYGVSFSRTEMKAIRAMLTTNLNGEEAAKNAGLSDRKLQEFVHKITKGGLEIL